MVQKLSILGGFRNYGIQNLSFLLPNPLFQFPNHVVVSELQFPFPNPSFRTQRFVSELNADGPKTFS